MLLEKKDFLIFFLFLFVADLIYVETFKSCVEFKELTQGSSSMGSGHHVGLPGIQIGSPGFSSNC